MRRAVSLAVALGLASLASAGLAGTVTVTARGETAPVGTAAADAADDPAIWRNPRRPAASLIVATDKKAGLYVYGLDGKVRSFVAAGRVNNVDLVDMGGLGVIVVASDRNDEAAAKLQIYRLDTRRARLIPLGAVPGGAGEAYGVCLMRRGQGLTAFSVLKHGVIGQYRLTLRAGGPGAALVRSYRLETQTEGCVADGRTGTLYVGEEDRGIWAFSTHPGTATRGRLVAPVDGAQLYADVEGLAIAPAGKRGGWLVASSQGDNAYAVYALPSLRPVGRFSIGAGKFGATEETDGIDLALGNFGPGFPLGLFVAQDGDNAPHAQNFKLVSWADVVARLKR